MSTKYFDQLTAGEQSKVVAEATLSLSGTKARFYTVQHEKKKEELAQQLFDEKVKVSKRGDMMGQDHSDSAHNSVKNDRGTDTTTVVSDTKTHTNTTNDRGTDDRDTDTATVVSDTKTHTNTTNDRGTDTSTVSLVNDSSKDGTTVVPPKHGGTVAKNNSKDGTNLVSAMKGGRAKRRIFEDSCDGKSAPPAKRTKQVTVVATPTKLEMVLEKADSLESAKEIGIEAVDKANTYKNQRFRSRMDNHVHQTNLARYKLERDTWAAYAQRAAAERNQAREEHDKLREEHDKLREEHDKLRKIAVRLGKERDQARIERDEVRTERAEHFRADD